jgi:hypothetical protein
MPRENILEKLYDIGQENDFFGMTQKPTVHKFKNRQIGLKIFFASSNKINRLKIIREWEKYLQIICLLIRN